MLEELEDVDQQVRILRRDHFGGVRPEFRVDGPDLATFETHLQLEFFGDAGQGRFKPTERAPVARNQQVRGQPVADLRDPAILDLATALAEIGSASCREIVSQYV